MRAPEDGRLSERRQRAIDRALVWISRIGRWMTLPFVHYEIRGGANARDSANMIIAANHRSLFDVFPGLITSVQFDQLPRVLIAREFFDRRIIGRMCRAIGAIPVDRGDGTAALSSAIAALKSGTPVIVMPEGKLHIDADDRTTTGEMRTGISRLATGSGVPIMAAGLLGTDRVWPPGAIPRLNPFRRKRVIVQVADDPLYLTDEDHRDNTSRLTEAIRRQILLAGDYVPELV